MIFLILQRANGKQDHQSSSADVVHLGDGLRLSLKFNCEDFIVKKLSDILIFFSFMLVMVALTGCRDQDAEVIGEESLIRPDTRMLSISRILWK